MLILCMACCVLEMAFKHSCEAQQASVDAIKLEGGHAEGVMAAQLLPCIYRIVLIGCLSLTALSFSSWSLFQRQCSQNEPLLMIQRKETLLIGRVLLIVPKFLVVVRHMCSATSYAAQQGPIYDAHHSKWSNTTLTRVFLAISMESNRP